MTFAQFNFHSGISKALQNCGYTQPTPIQVNSIPEILKGNDLVATAQTGTGKTAAFILPALQKLSDTPSSGKPRVLVLTPTRELAAQIITAAEKYGKFLNFKMVTLVGGTPYRQQLRDLSRPCDIIVATPGRLLDHMENRKVDLSGVDMLILDEADRMLDMGFIDDVKQISKATPRARQTLLFSATVDERLSSIIKQLLKEPVRIDLSSEKLTPKSIKQQVYIADSPQHKAKLLEYFLKDTSIFKAIIFSATKVNADRMAGDLKNQGLAVAALHGDLKQAVRNRTIEQFRRGKVNFLVATDVAARGIDVSDVTHVFNYDLPKFSEDYVHRIGRTGRAGKTGIAISFVLPMENRHLQKIERYTGQRLEVATVLGLESKKGLDSGAPKKSRKSGGKKKHFSGDKDAKRSFSRSAGDKKFSGKKSEDRPFRDKKTGEKSFSDRKSGDRPFRDKKTGEKSFSDRKSGDRPFRDKKSGDKPFSDRRTGDKSFRDKKTGEKSFSDRKSGDRPFRDKKSGDKPFSDRRTGDKSFRDKKAGEKSFSNSKPSKKFGEKNKFEKKGAGFAGKSGKPSFSKKRSSKPKRTG